eukprot:4484766-Pleurochrysis_carterae.AAC.8
MNYWYCGICGLGRAAVTDLWRGIRWGAAQTARWAGLGNHAAAIAVAVAERRPCITMLIETSAGL